MTHAEKVQQLFENSNGKIITPMDVINYINSIAYSERITGARNKWGCSCGNNPDTCTATQHIINIGKNKYIYKGIKKAEPKKETIKPVSQAQIGYKLQLLREKYRKAENDTDKRLIQLQANILKNTLVKQEEKQVNHTVADMRSDEVLGVLA